MEELIDEVIEKFNSAAEKEGEHTKYLENMERNIEIEIGEKIYYCKLKDKKIMRHNEKFEKCDIKVITDEETFLGIMRKEINPLKAYIEGKLKVRASLTDLVLMRKLLL
ncbi:MAG: SCP2 sterol-binding domain-containing protein [Candidatus Thermoplasmatota archaeon]